MTKTSLNIHHNTPEVTVVDNRGLTVRDIRYHRHPDTPEITEERITRHAFTDRGQAHTSADPRLSKMQINNFEYLTTHSGQPLLTTGVDNGTVLSFNDAAGRPHMEINATGVTRTWQYEDTDSPGRPLTMSEQEDGGDVRVTERFVYAGGTEAEQALNLAGLCVRHYDTAGLQQTDSVSLTGVPLSITRRLLKDVDSPESEVAWRGEDEHVWQAILSETAYTTLSTADAVGAMLTTTDAMDNTQRVTYDVAGLLKGSCLTLKNGQEQVIIKSLMYSAAGQKLREEHGNGVVTTYTYEPQTQRLIGIKTERPQNHQQGQKVLQDLRYQYDPVGNVLSVRNDAEATRYWRNQKVVPENTYVYDSLYQLVSATGREMANMAQQGTHLPAPLIPLASDNSAYTRYTRSYKYDAGNNLTQIHHHAPATGNTYTTAITVSDRSNRAVLSTLADKSAKVDALFTAGGHQIKLIPGQELHWTPRGELRQTHPVSRDEQASDNEHYRYDGNSQRVIKISTQQTSKSVQTQRTLYLPGLELRTSTKEALHTITVGETGRAQVRVLHWERSQPDGISNNQVCYSYDSLAGSSGLEVDAEGNIISLEEYYPYGSTAILTARSQTEAGYKTHRFSGKERDATGLYYYGYRYYQPWVGRWLSADPAGIIDGINLFRMVQNNPVSFKDDKGLSPVDISKSRGTSSYIANKNTEGKRYLSNLTFNEASQFDIPVLSKNNLPKVTHISHATLNHLRLAQNANIKTKELLPYGSSNMGVDIYRTGAKNIALRRKALLESSVFNIETSIKYGVGNCAEHSMISFKLLSYQGLSKPVFRVRASGMDHNYSVIGDYREKGTVVVADSWVTLPVSHLADEGRFEIDSIIEQAPTNHPYNPRYAIDDTLRLSEFTELDVPPVEEYIKNQVINNRTPFSEYSSLKNVGFSYYSEGSIYRFDEFSSQKISQFLKYDKGYSRILNCH